MNEATGEDEALIGRDLDVEQAVFDILRQQRFFEGRFGTLELGNELAKVAVVACVGWLWCISPTSPVWRRLEAVAQPVDGSVELLSTIEVVDAQLDGFQMSDQAGNEERLIDDRQLETNHPVGEVCRQTEFSLNAFLPSLESADGTRANRPVLDVDRRIDRQLAEQLDVGGDDFSDRIVDSHDGSDGRHDAACVVVDAAEISTDNDKKKAPSDQNELIDGGKGNGEISGWESQGIGGVAREPAGGPFELMPIVGTNAAEPAESRQANDDILVYLLA